MPGRRLIHALLFACACCAFATAIAQDEPVGIVADPCMGQKTSEQLPGDAWPAYIATHDFGRLCRYRAQNATLQREDKPAVRVVFMGDSITEGWERLDPSFFSDGKVDRGISGQTTAQMLLRFRQDVIDLHPQVVHILAGTNDIAGNTGPVTLAQVEGNLASMAELAQAHGIRVVFGSVPPAARFPWRPNLVVGTAIEQLNRWIQAYAARNGHAYIDYYHAMATDDGVMQPSLSDDGVHPTLKGYKAMEPLAEAALRKALAAQGKPP